jgi:hypothetical protein
MQMQISGALFYGTPALVNSGERKRKHAFPYGEGREFIWVAE